MLVVALTRFGPAGASTPAPAELEREAQALSPTLGVGLYELRLALAAPPPVVLLESSDVERVRQLLGVLRARGHGAVACDAASVIPSEQMLSPKTFSFEPEELVVENPGIERRAVPYSDILALFSATHVTRADSTEQRSEKKLSLGRAALTGGLVRSKSHSVTEHRSTEDREAVLYVMHRSGAGHVLLRESRLHYTGLGPRLGRSTTENFKTTVELVRQRAGGARYDDRLLKQRRAAGSLRVSGSAAARTVTSSNDAEVDLACHLLAVALLQGQL